MHIPLLLDMAADGAGDRPAYGRRTEHLTFAEARRGDLKCATFLGPMGGRNIVFLGLNGRALPLALYAAGLLGRPFVPLNYRLPDEDLNKLLARSAPAVAIVDDAMASRLCPLAGVTVVLRSAFEATAVASGEDQGELPQTPHDIAVVLFTSGTTGEPKGAVLRHHNLTSYVISTVEFLGAGEDEATLVSVPPYHIAGISALLTSTYCGRRVVHLDSFSPEEWVDTAAAEGVTHAMLVPTMLGRVLTVLEARGESLPGMRAISYGGGRMPLPVIERALALLPHVDFSNAYGLTETASTVSILGPEDHRLALAAGNDAGRRRLGSVGRPLPSLELEIRDPDGKTMEPNASGEIFVRGAQVSGEYLASRVIDDEGWFGTHDGGYLDEEGYLFVEGRLDDVIVRGGENMSPGEIEDVLREHPGISDAAVVGVPDLEWGEKVAAVVVPAAEGEPPATHELEDWVKSRLRSSKIPQLWAFRAALPYNDMGKLLRRQLKAELVDAVNPA